MNFFFKTKQKGPVELVKATHDAMVKVESGSEHQRSRANDEISKNVASMLQILRDGGADRKVPDTSSEQVAQLAQEIYTTELLPLLIGNLGRLEFETRKEVSIIFGILLRRRIGTREPTVEYLNSRTNVLASLVTGYANPDAAIFCGNMLRECFKHEALVRTTLNLPEFLQFFDYVEGENFDVTSDAFNSFHEALTKFKEPANAFLTENYDAFFAKYTQLLESSNYVVRRQSLKLLGEILLEHKNFHVMIAFIRESANLKMVMNALNDRSKSIQYEAFHIFKIFVANPKKAPEVHKILYKNKDKLVKFLVDFQNDKNSDEQFRDEKAFLVKGIRELEPPPA
ncbi:conidiophore development protein hyma [Coemansia biformis]|uniref:Conidiophore development protein hyma n=1 Tax=Coemansia biformis TaxID=1286918 RepID=A0A9W7YHM3_9FUNG|nr:conidiophore development protein hyma [Coemansia biformis]